MTSWGSRWGSRSSEAAIFLLEFMVEDVGFRASDTKIRVQPLQTHAINTTFEDMSRFRVHKAEITFYRNCTGFRAQGGQLKALWSSGSRLYYCPQVPNGSFRKLGYYIRVPYFRKLPNRSSTLNPKCQNVLIFPKGLC